MTSMAGNERSPLNRPQLIWIESRTPYDLEQVACQLPQYRIRWTATAAEAEALVREPETVAVFLRWRDAQSELASVLAIIRQRGLGLVVHARHGEPPIELPADTAVASGNAPARWIADNLRRAAETGPHTEAPAPWERTLIGRSAAMQEVVEQIRLIAPRRSTVLITGETGTGKEVAARAIHLASGRGARPMVSVNCSALPENLLEAELFGHTKGAFTGAVQARAGKFEQAHQSTIFLDEIGDMPFDLQAKLLRVLQEREIERLGGGPTVKVDVRVIAATNVDLAAAVREKRFREDLFYRLNVVPVALPPLRERAGDVPLLAAHFIERICAREGLPVKQLSAAAAEVLSRYEWPGNVRQLEHTIESAVILSDLRPQLEVSDFRLPSAKLPQRELVRIPDEGIDFEAMMSEIQRYLLAQALERAGGNKSRAAGLLRMKRSTLVSKVKALGDAEFEIAS
jgi:transcriptional regulator with GAF, ATPase, and Fis domain